MYGARPDDKVDEDTLFMQCVFPLDGTWEQHLLYFDHNSQHKRTSRTDSESGEKAGMFQEGEYFEGD